MQATMVYKGKKLHNMSMQNMTSNKPNMPKLEQILPEGLVVDRKWLYAQGYERSTVDYFLRSGRLERVKRGVYRRPGPPLKWLPKSERRITVT